MKHVQYNLGKYDTRTPDEKIKKSSNFLKRFSGLLATIFEERYELFT